jgi:hypothetical protein
MSDEEDNTDKFRLDKKVALQIIFDHLKKFTLQTSKHGLIFKSKLKTQPSVGGIKIHENQFSYIRKVKNIQEK